MSVCMVLLWWNGVPSRVYSSLTLSGINSRSSMTLTRIKHLLKMSENDYYFLIQQIQKLIAWNQSKLSYHFFFQVFQH